MVCMETLDPARRPGQWPSWMLPKASHAHHLNPFSGPALDYTSFSPAQTLLAYTEPATAKLPQGTSLHRHPLVNGSRSRDVQRMPSEIALATGEGKGPLPQIMRGTCTLVKPDRCRSAFRWPPKSPWRLLQPTAFAHALRKPLFDARHHAIIYYAVATESRRQSPSDAHLDIRLPLTDTLMPCS